jgi:hypothetical protein
MLSIASKNTLNVGGQKVDLRLNLTQLDKAKNHRSLTHTDRQKLPECKKDGCRAVLYKQGLCKNHMLDVLRAKMRQTLKLCYREPESAFATFNFSGTKNVTMDNILNHMIIPRIGFSKEEIAAYLLRDKVFESRTGEINYA